MSQGGRGATSLLRYVLAAMAGLFVVFLLGGPGTAQQACVTTTPQVYSPPGCNFAATSTSPSGQPTATFTPTLVPGQPTATFTPVNQAQQSTAGTILNGRGRIANVRTNAFTVIWTTDAEVIGQVNYGASSTALQNPAYDVRGQAFAGQTHYVDVTGLQAGVTYFFDVVSGGQVDNNGGQHYQVRTAPDITGSAQGNYVQGSVLNPGGGSPAGGALVWGDVKDANGQGSSGTSQLLAALAGADGRFRLDLNPRIADLTAFFTYSNAGDQVELSARGGQGEASQTVDTSTTYGGGTASQDARLVLQPVTAATATFTPVPGASPTPIPTATATVAPAQPFVTFTPTPAFSGVPPTPLPPPFPTPTPPAVQMPVQLPTLKEMLLAQVGVLPATPTAVAIARAQPQPAQPTPAQPAAGPGGSLPGQPGAAVPPVGVAPLVATATPMTQAPAQPQPAAGQPAAPGGAVPPGSAPPATGAPIVRPAPGAPPAIAPPLGTPFGRGATPVGAGVQGPPPPTVRSVAAVTATPAGSFAGLASMPAQVSVLFYGGVILALLGAGIGIYSVLAGPGWRPR